MDLNNYEKDDITSLEKDIQNFENNISKLRIIFFYVNNYKISYQNNKKVLIENRILKKKDLIKYIDEEKQSNKNEDYKLNFLIKFILNYDLYNLSQLETSYDKNSYKLQCLKQIDDIDFTDSKFDKENTLILFFDKIYKIQKLNYIIKQKNSSRKKNNKS